MFVKVEGDNKWERIKQAWKLRMPYILEVHKESEGVHGTDPYFYPWNFTRIEMNVWNDIRVYGIPFYPQVPAGNRFIDFGDPFLKIGIEADGKEWHEKNKDIKRDKELNKLGWTIYHVTGAETFRVIKEEEIEDYESDNGFYIKRINLDNSSEGLVWALKYKYYIKELFEDMGKAEYILEKHLLI